MTDAPIFAEVEAHASRRKPREEQKNSIDEPVRACGRVCNDREPTRAITGSNHDHPAGADDCLTESSNSGAVHSGRIQRRLDHSGLNHCSGAGDRRNADGDSHNARHEYAGADPQHHREQARDDVRSE
jgi:hypothetical protein